MIFYFTIMELINTLLYYGIENIGDIFTIIVSSYITTRPQKNTSMRSRIHRVFGMERGQLGRG